MRLEMKVKDVQKLTQTMIDLQQLLNRAKSEMEENLTKLTEKNDMLIQELTLIKSKLDKKESDFKQL